MYVGMGDEIFQYFFFLGNEKDMRGSSPGTEENQHVIYP